MNSHLEQVISGCIKNDRRHQEELYKLFFPKMMTMVRRYTTDQDKAISILNDGFLKVFKNIKSYKGSGSFEGWVRRLVFTSISDFFRKENKYLKLMLFEEAEKETNTSALDDLYYDDLLKLVNRLPGNTHKVFNLYAIEGFNHREIGEILEISEGTSKWHLSEARKMLKVLLNMKSKSVNHAG